jgi:hypothetical protein
MATADFEQTVAIEKAFNEQVGTFSHKIDHMSALKAFA